jgi:hypothetical protein
VISTKVTAWRLVPGDAKAAEGRVSLMAATLGRPAAGVKPPKDDPSAGRHPPAASPSHQHHPAQDLTNH